MTTLTQPAPTRTHAVRWFWAGGLIALLGLAAAAAWAMTVVLATVATPGQFARTAMPGTATVVLAAGDGQVVYYEGPGTPGAQDLGLRVTAPDGAAVATSAYRGDLRYDTASGTGRAVATFNAPAAGTYRITATTPGHDATIAVGPSIAHTAAHGLIGPGLIAAAAVVLGLTCAAVPFTKPKPAS